MNQPAPKPPPSPLAKLKIAADARKAEWSKLLPRHVDVERFAKSIIIACSNTPALMSANPDTLWKAASTAASLGLDCSGVLGSAYLIPYGQVVQLIIGYRGLIDLARRSREIKSIYCQLVYANDEFDVSLGTAPSIVHRPNYDGDRGPVKFAYAVAELMGGGTQFEIMSVPQMEAIRKASRNGNRGPWVDHTEEMYRKTVIRRLIKYLPLSPEMIQAEQAEDENHRMIEDKSTPTASIADLPTADVVVEETPTEREPGQEG